MPTVLEIYGYSFFCCGCLCGPFFEFADYKNFIEMKGDYANVPDTIIPSLIRFMHGKCKYSI